MISVADTGTGIPPEVLTRVLEPFFTTKEVGKGTGLGLPMVYGLAQQSGGTVTIRSTVGAGTTVELYLSRAAAEREDGPTREADHCPGRAKVRILLVDDDAEVRTVTAAYLADMGHRVVEAADGASALDILRTDDQLDLLIADFAMPGMTGTRPRRQGAGDPAGDRHPSGDGLCGSKAPAGRLSCCCTSPSDRIDLAAKISEAARHRLN